LIGKELKGKVVSHLEGRAISPWVDGLIRKELEDPSLTVVYISGNRGSATPARKCKCGCGEDIPRGASARNRKYINSEHRKRDLISKRGPVPECLCGCGEEVSWGSGKWRKYCAGHYQMLQKEQLASRKRVRSRFKVFRDSRNEEFFSRIMKLPEVKAIWSEMSKTNFDDEDYRESWQEGVALRPNGFEQQVALLGPSGMEYIGDGSLWIEFLDGSRKNPDFRYGEKFIECHGDYWHEGEDSEELVEKYRAAGYECLVVWEKELEDPSSVRARLHEFCGESLEARQLLLL
jgi:hypothetical protein